MKDAPNITTMDALLKLGFVPSQSPGNSDGLVFKCDNGDLEAFPPDYTGRALLLGSVDRTARTLYAPIEHYLPGSVVSEQQCAALLFYYLRDYPLRPRPPWLIEGQQRQDLLPWNFAAAQRKVAFDALPKCSIKREWLRMALKDLGASLAAEGQGALVLFGFSDGVLFIQHGQTKIATPASGSDWPEVIAVQATEFRELPKRLMTKDILVVVGESHLRIGTLHYRLAQNGAS